MKILLANPRGFCAGVDRAIDIVERAIALFGAPIYVRHEVVHNRYVVDDLKQKGAIFVEELHEVPDGATVIFSAHGVSRAVQAEANNRELNVFDATCPLVTKVHMEVKRYRERDIEVVMIGHEGHPEVDGTMGQSDTGMYLVDTIEDVQQLQVSSPEKLAYVSQTTLSVDDTQQVIDALKDKFPQIIGPKKDDIPLRTDKMRCAHCREMPTWSWWLVHQIARTPIVCVNWLKLLVCRVIWWMRPGNLNKNGLRVSK